MISTPPRSEWEQATASTYDLVADFLLENEIPLFSDDTMCHVLTQMGDNPRTLDVCCGAGRLIPVLGGFGIKNVVGVDFSKELIQRARVQYPEIDFRVGNILALKDVVGPEPFDAFWMIASLMHILPENLPQVVANIREVLRVGAVGFISTPCGEGEDLLGMTSNDMNGGVIPEGHYMFRKLWDIRELVKYFEGHGFEVIFPSYSNGMMVDLTVRAI